MKQNAITTTTIPTGQPAHDDDRVTVILPGGAVVICRPDQVSEVTRPAWQPMEITCGVGHMVADPMGIHQQIAAVARGGSRC